MGLGRVSICKRSADQQARQLLRPADIATAALSGFGRLPARKRTFFHAGLVGLMASLAPPSPSAGPSPEAAGAAAAAAAAALSPPPPPPLPPSPPAATEAVPSFPAADLASDCLPLSPPCWLAAGLLAATASPEGCSLCRALGFDVPCISDCFLSDDVSVWGAATELGAAGSAPPLPPDRLSRFAQPESFAGCEDLTSDLSCLLLIASCCCSGACDSISAAAEMRCPSAAVTSYWCTW